MVTPEGTATALVIGAGSGIGRATALLLAESGVDVVAADLNAEAAASVASQHAGITTVGDRSWDATDRNSCEQLLDAAVAQLGHVDQVISTVGWTAITPFLEETPEYWRRIIDVNLMSAIYIAAAAGRVLQPRGGSIVLTSSEAGQVGTSGETVYSAAKAGIVGLVKSLAREWARYRDPGQRRRPGNHGRRRCWRVRAETRSLPASSRRSRCGGQVNPRRSRRRWRSWPRTGPATSPDRPSASVAA